MRDHFHLSESDQCVCFGEYTARAGFGFSDINRLIANFKKPMDRYGRPEWQYKEEAIDRIVKMLAQQINLEALASNGVTLVPLPPSSPKGDPAHDNRLLRVLNGLKAHKAGLDVRELLLCHAGRPPSHTQADGHRPSPEQHAANMYIDENCAAPSPRVALLVDDVLTTGATYKGAEIVLKKRFPEASFGGLFIARRALPKNGE